MTTTSFGFSIDTTDQQDQYKNGYDYSSKSTNWINSIHTFSPFLVSPLLFINPSISKKAFPRKDLYLSKFINAISSLFFVKQAI